MKQHRYALLDGVRGMAAIYVLTRHTHNFWQFEFYRCYLAVDLFFILSGFVIAYAYDRKLEQRLISFIKFLKIRIIRLYPVFFLSIILSVFNLAHESEKTGQTFYEILMITAKTAFFIPAHFNGKDDLFTINGPYWSLFYELIINFVYAGTRQWLNDLKLLVIVIFFAFLIGIASYLHANLDAGFIYSLKSLAAGLTRSAFGFFTGLFLYKKRMDFGQIIDKYISPIFAFILIAIILASPDVGRFNWIIDFLTVVIIFPICILASSSYEGKKFEKFLLALGTASYPIYVLHKPVGEFISTLVNGLETTQAPASGFILVFLLFTLSLSLEKNFDIPLRRRLTNYFVKIDRKTNT